MIRAQTISRLLSNAGYERSTSHASAIRGVPFIRSGYRVRTGYEPGTVYVDFTPGDGYRYQPDSHRKKAEEAALTGYTQILAHRYDVTRDGDKLIVRNQQ